MDIRIEHANTSAIRLEGQADSLKDFVEEKKSGMNDTDLRNANLRNADLRNADLRNADLSEASLRNANLINANLINANLPIFCKWTVSYIVKSEKEKITIEELVLDDLLIVIGCKQKTIKDWDIWFASDEEYSTKRDSFEFKRIKGMYLAVKSYLECVYGEVI